MKLVYPPLPVTPPERIKTVKRKVFEDAAKKMPPLTHSMADGSFDPMGSEAARWLVNQPGVRQTVFQLAQESGAIKFDHATKTWVGVDHQEAR